MITYTVGDATTPKGEGNKIIVHVCNDIGGWGRGFVLALSKKWQEPELAYRNWYKNNPNLDFELGNVGFVQVEENIHVANLIGQRDVRSIEGIPPIRYEAVMQGLSKVAQFALEINASIHMPRIGCGLAGGSWGKVEPIIITQLSNQGINTTVYDLPEHKNKIIWNP